MDNDEPVTVWGKVDTGYEYKPDKPTVRLDNPLEMRRDPAIEKAFRDRMRLRVIRIPERLMFEAAVAFLTDQPPAEYKEVIENLKLSPDLEVLSVHHEYPSKSFGITVHHPSFDPVPEGAPIPDLFPHYAWIVKKVGN